MSKARDLADSVAAGGVLADGAVLLSEVGGGTSNGVVFVNGSGTTTSGSALTFDGTNLSVGGSNSQQKLNVVVPVFTTNASGGMRIGDSGNNYFVDQLVTTDGSANPFWDVKFATHTLSRYGYGGGNNFWAWYANNSEQMRLTSTGLGIGTSSPSTTIDINGGTKNQVAIFRSTDAVATIGFADNTTPLTGNLSYVTIGAEGNAMVFNTNLNERMRIDSAGDVLLLGGILRIKDSGNTAQRGAIYGDASSLHINAGVNNLIAYTAGTQRLTIDSSGNLGLGVTPSGWLSSVKAFQFGAGGLLDGRTNDAAQATIGAGYYLDSSATYKYLSTTGATRFVQASGAYLWFTAPSGTAGAAISFTQAMTLTAAGNLGIGTTLPGEKLTVAGGLATTGIVARFVNPVSGGDAKIGFSDTLTYNWTAGTTGNNFTISSAEYGTNAGVERVRITAAGSVGIGTTSPAEKLEVAGGIRLSSYLQVSSGSTGKYFGLGSSITGAYAATDLAIWNVSAGNTIFYQNGGERARIDSSGTLFIGRTADTEDAGLTLEGSGFIRATRDGGTVMVVNRNTNDGDLISFRQAGTTEGTISVSGTTVSYNGGHLSRWAQTTTAKDHSLVKGTVLSNLDEMNVYTDADGNPVDNEQLNKVKVSDVDGDANVAGVFVNWTYDEQHSVDEINMAMTGDMIIRIAQGVTVVRGDLLMSAGNGTAKPQGDDIVRSKTIAKVTSTHVTCTYEDGSYCVPCVLMAC
jgi:hypothetical protein